MKKIQTEKSWDFGQVVAKCSTITLQKVFWNFIVLFLAAIFLILILFNYERYCKRLNLRHIESWSGKLKLCRYFHHVLRFLNLLYVALSLIRCRVTRRLTRIQTMCNILKYHKTIYNDSVRSRFGSDYFFNLLKIQYCKWWVLALLDMRNIGQTCVQKLYMYTYFLTHSKDINRTAVDQVYINMRLANCQ